MWKNNGSLQYWKKQLKRANYLINLKEIKIFIFISYNKRISNFHSKIYFSDFIEIK